MLTNLYISNIVLIEKLSISFSKGLNILTGETGAGKSILMDALNLALGGKTDTSLIRSGNDTAQVIAEFDNVSDFIKNILSENAIDDFSTLILRRIISKDGKTKSFINDIPVSLKTLKLVGDNLIEVHGQFENHSLLDPSLNIKYLDEFGKNSNNNYKDVLDSVANSYKELHTVQKQLKELEDLSFKSSQEKDFLEYSIKELENLNIQKGEESNLTDKHNKNINLEKNTEILENTLKILESYKFEDSVYSAARNLERIKISPNPYQNSIDKLYEIGGSLSEIIENIRPKTIDKIDIDKIEERLFTIRSISRKYKISSDEIPQKLQDMIKEFNQINNLDEEIKKLSKQVKDKEKEYLEASKQLTQLRIALSKKLRDKILNELPDLKLSQADFKIDIKESQNSSLGNDEIIFMVKMNPGSPFSPLHKTASGGELSRLMLILSVIFNTGNKIFVFDEVDTGISGAVASSVGQRLERLSKAGQVIVITHSAQVAGFADKHFKIEKKIEENNTKTIVFEIENKERLEEIARIISGEKITQQAIETAKTLIKKNN